MKVRLNLIDQAAGDASEVSGGRGRCGAVQRGNFFLALGWHVYSVRKADETLRAKVASFRHEMTGLEPQRKDLEHFSRSPTMPDSTSARPF